MRAPRVTREIVEPPLRIGFVPVIRPAFKGDAPRASEASLSALRELGTSEGFIVQTASIGSETMHPATDQRVPPYVVTSAAEAARAAAELREAEIDLLVVQHTTFATGDLLAPLLQGHPRVGIWALPEEAGGRGRTGPLPLNALCGLNMTLSLARSPAVAREGHVAWFYGGAEDAWFRERWGSTLAAVRALRALDGARILQIGGTAPGFYRLEEMPEGLPGVAVETRPLGALYEAVRRVDDAEARKRAADWRAEPADASADHLLRAARLDLALAALAEDAGADALAVRCWPELPDACGAMACLAMGESAGRGVPAACEGDVMGALSMLVLQAVSRSPAILMDISDLDRHDDSLQVWHCGNAPLQWAADGRPTRLTTHFNRDGVGVVRDMVLRPGPATGFRLLDGGRRAWILSGVVASPEKDGFDGVRGWVRDLRWNGRPCSARAAVTQMLDLRLPHHLAMGSGDGTRALRELGQWIGAEPIPAESPEAEPIPAEPPGSEPTTSASSSDALETT